MRRAAMRALSAAYRVTEELGEVRMLPTGKVKPARNNQVATFGEIPRARDTEGAAGVSGLSRQASDGNTLVAMSDRASRVASQHDM